MLAPQDGCSGGTDPEPGSWGDGAVLQPLPGARLAGSEAAPFLQLYELFPCIAPAAQGAVRCSEARCFLG